MICVRRMDGTCVPARGRRRAISGRRVSWDLAARLADQLPADDADRLAMRIAPRTLACANGFRINRPIASNRFEELRGLCAEAGDKASVAIATMGLLGEHLIQWPDDRSLPVGRRIYGARRVDRGPDVDCRACHRSNGRQVSRRANRPRCCGGQTWSSIWPRVTPPWAATLLDLRWRRPTRCVARPAGGWVTPGGKRT